jgi:hypothetical protein
MARRRVSRKTTPAVTRLWFHINSRNDYNYVDLSLAASIANRRFYRQSSQWAVAGMSLHTFADSATPTVAPNGSFTVQKIPDTWVAHNAHTKAKSLWMQSQRQVLDENPSIKGKYNDFKIFMDEDMTGSSIQGIGTSAAADTEILVPVDALNNATRVGEWIYSTVQLPDDGGSNPPTEVTMHMVGDDVTSAPESRSIIHGYALSRSRPQKHDPNIPSDGGWMNDVFDVADNLDEIREDVTENNDVPPYRVGDANDPLPSQDAEFYPGGPNNVPGNALHSRQFISASTIGGKTHIEGGLFGCGLMKFNWNISDAQGSMYLAIDLVPGNYKGYLTEVY